MNANAITAILKPAVLNETLHTVTTTSVQNIYFNRIEEVAFDDGLEIMSYIEKSNKRRFYLDYQDINFIILKPE